MRGDAQAVPGDADVPREPLVAGLHERLDGAAGTVGDVPLVGLDEVVQLDEVDVVDAHPGSERSSSARAASPRRSPVLVARNTLVAVRSPATAAGGPPDAPYDAAVSMWLMPQPGDGGERGVGALLAHRRRARRRRR